FMRQGDHLDFAREPHSRFFEAYPERSIDEADSWKVLDARKAHPAQLAQEGIHEPERIGAADAGKHRGRAYDRQYLARHVDDDGIGVAIGHHSGERAAPRHAES